MNKRHLILLHGALGSKEQLAPLARMLEDQFDVSTFNFEGHGDRFSNKDFSMDLFVENLLDHFEEKQIERADIFGYSMGGYVALMTALKHPQPVRSIMTLGTKFDWNIEVAAREVKMLDPDKVQAKVPAFAERLSALHTANNWKDVMRKTAKLMTELGNGKGLTESDLKMITTPTTIALGQLDQMVSLEESEQTADLLPDASFVSIEGFRHPIEKVDLKSLAAIIRQLY